LWGDDHQITAVEVDPEIVDIYSDLFPDDVIEIADAHKFLLQNYQEFDFIWSSPPCPTHSRFNNLKNNIPESQKRYPDMKLYEEIIFLKHFFKSGFWVVENVISYYDPLIKPFISHNHYFWSNLKIPYFESESRDIRNRDLTIKQERLGFDLSNYGVTKNKQRTLLNNCVQPELALAILENAKKGVKNSEFI
jgi:DNA (cytosine-5)-methyltransferase 1